MNLLPRSWIILCFCLPLLAEADEFSSEKEYFLDLPTVLSASRLAQPLAEAPNAMTVIDRKIIVASGFRTLPDLFKLVPGMYVGYYKGGQAFVSYHGSTDQYARRMQVMIDGRSVYLPPLSAVDWTDLPITVDDIERIEVIRGPAAASHGANSTQGVISIITRDAGGVDGKYLSYTHGSKGINDVSTRFGQRGEKLDYRMTLAYTADNGYDHLSSPPNNMTLAQAPGDINNGFDSNQARLMNYRAGYHPNGIDSYDVQFGFNHDVKSVGWWDSTGNQVHDLIANSNFAQLGWLRALGDASELSVRYYHIRHDQHEAFPMLRGGVFYAGPYSQSVNTARDELELQHTLASSAANRIVYGAAWRNDHVDTRRSDIPPSAQPAYASSFDMKEWRVFAHDEWRVQPDWLLNTGAMYESNGLGQKNLSPRIALNFHALPQHTFRLGISVAYRTPSLMETNFPTYQPGELFVLSSTVTSPGLKPERLLSREIGYIGQFSDSTLDMRLFSDQLSDGIFWGNTAFVNKLSYQYRGFETTLKHSFSEAGELTLNLARASAHSNGAALLASGYGSLRSEAPWTNDILSGSVPRNSGSLLYSLQVTHELAFSAAYYYQAAMQPFDRGPVDFQPPQHRTDMRVSQAIDLAAGVKANAALVIQDLFNQGYTDYVSTSMFNRRAYLVLGLNW